MLLGLIRVPSFLMYVAMPTFWVNALLQYNYSTWSQKISKLNVHRLVGTIELFNRILLTSSINARGDTCQPTQKAYVTNVTYNEGPVFD